MSVTAVPLPPIERRALGWLWLALAVLALVGIAGAWYGTRNIALPAKVFLARNAKKPGIVVMPSGLQYQVIRAGSGARPTVGDIALISYEGRFADGTLFDRGGPAPIPVGRMFPGFNEGLALMPVGSKYRLWIPPALGMPEGSGPVPPNSLLIFDIDLLTVVPQSAMRSPAAMPAAGMPPPASDMPEVLPPQSEEPPSGVTVHSGEPAPEMPAPSTAPPASQTAQ
jgi:hypothetical protein